MARTGVRKQGYAALVLAGLLALGAGPAAAVKAGPARAAAPDLIVIHSTGGPTCDAASGRPVWVGGGTMADNLRVIEAHPRLGIHYMIGRDGELRASVPEHQVAHHVFRHSVRSIAIELINDGDGRDPFPPAQLDTLVELLRTLAARHGIGAAGVRRHSDLDLATLPCDRSQPRKVDPGPAFPFEAVLERVYAGPAARAGSPRP